MQKREEINREGRMEAYRGTKIKVLLLILYQNKWKPENNGKFLQKNVKKR